MKSTHSTVNTLLSSPIGHKIFPPRRNRPNITLPAVVLAIFLSVTNFVTSTPAVADTVWKCTLTVPAKGVFGESINNFANQIKIISDNEIHIDIDNCIIMQPTAQNISIAGKSLNVLGGTAIDLFSYNEPFLRMESLPFLAENYDELKWFHGFWQPKIQDILENQFGRKLLYMVPDQPKYILTTKEVNTIDDLQSLKVGTQNSAEQRLFEALGAEAIDYSLSDVVQGLHKGTINALSVASISHVDNTVLQSFSFMYPTNHSWAPNAVTVDLDAWNSLPEDIRQNIEQVAGEMQPAMWKAAAQHDVGISSYVGNLGIAKEVFSDAQIAYMKEHTDEIRKSELSKMGELAIKFAAQIDEFKGIRKCPPYCKRNPPEFCAKNPKLCK